MNRRELAVPFGLFLLLTWSLACTPTRHPPTSTAPAGAAKKPRVIPGPVDLTLDLGSGVKLELVRIAAGEYQMGSPPTEEHHAADEAPRHVVKIARPFFIGRFEVTQAQWQSMLGADPSWYRGDDLPVNKVSWDDAQEFCQALSKKVRRTVRLPTEAEWEYVCRAGTDTAFSFGDDPRLIGDYAWFRDNGGSQPHAVGEKKPNAWGLYDTCGNVWEWCQDAFHPDYNGAPSEAVEWLPSDPMQGRMLRGGSWFSPSPLCRSAFRLRRTQGMRSGYIGFRVVVEAEK